MSDRYTLHIGDNREVLRTFADASIDSIVCDPPYELGFMGKKWDASGIAYDATLWAECLRVLKPGGHLLAFGGTRTYHRMTVAIEDAGFEIRDCLQWMYGSGFPKSHNLHDAWHGWGTALKPSWEPIVMARKPLHGTVADNVLAWGAGAINIDGCRVGDASAGRWPANTLLDEEAAAMLDAQSEVSRSSPNTRHNNEPNGVAYGKYGANITFGYSDSGGASRFFYVAKASKAEREAGLDGMEVKPAGGMQGRQDGTLAGEPVRRSNNHPTVKPIALMRYLVRMVTPRDGVVLDPFMGSGSTGCGAMLEGMRFVGIELSEEYAEIARRRIEYWASQNPMNLQS